MVGKHKWLVPLSCFCGALLLLPYSTLAQNPAGAGQGKQRPSPSDPAAKSRLEIQVTEDSGGPILVLAVVTLKAAEGGVVRQASTSGGDTEIDDLAPGHYTLQVTAQGYDSAKQLVDATEPHSIVKVVLHRKASDDMDQSSMMGYSDIGGDQFGRDTNVKEMRMLLRIAQALRDHKPEKARMDLEKLYYESSTDTNLSYLYGEYEKEMNDMNKAKFYWKRAVGEDSKNFAALMELGHAAIDEGNPAEALTYLKRAVKASPTVWHPHAYMVVAYLKLHQIPEAVEEAQRAIALGHSQAAAVVQPTLASALVAEGKKDQAIQILDVYVKDNPDDAESKNLLASLRQPPASSNPPAPALELPPLLPSAWMPHAVDDSVPPVEPGVPCSLPTVLHKASTRMTELVDNLQRFEATEDLRSQRIGNDGLPASVQTRTYRYLVSIEEIRPGMLSVDEFRDSKNKYQDGPPDGIVTVGLPALALVFHPSQSVNFDFTCEGLSRTGSVLAWQVYFKQKPDRVPTLHAYSRAGQVYPVGLKGRAWIAADTYQLIRLESDLVKSHPQIRLVAEHTQIKYGPVRFRTRDLSLWLPERAEVYFDWQGKRVHRQLSFSDFTLFSVDANQQIKAPKDVPPPQDKPDGADPVRPD